MTQPHGLAALLVARGLSEDEARLLVRQWHHAHEDANDKGTVRSASARRFIVSIVALAMGERRHVPDVNNDEAAGPRREDDER